MLKTLTAETFNSGTVPFKETAQALLANGFTPIPLVDGQKFPNIRGWQETIREDVPGLIESHGNTRSTGLLLGIPDDSGYSLVAIDHDVYDEELAKDLRQDSMVQRGGPIRIGQAPKFLQLFKTRDPRLLRKRQSPIYIDNAGRKNMIEILGAGQCVVSGIHPGTGQPYRWQNLDGTPALGPFGMSIADFPEIDAEGVDVRFIMLDAYAVMLGDMTMKGSSTTPDSPPPAGELTEEEEVDRLLYLAGKRRGITIDEAEKDLRWVQADDYDTWVKVGMAMKFEFQGSPEGLESFDRWSATAPNYAGRAGVEAKWRSFDELPMDREPVTWGTIVHLKEEAIRTSDVGPDITAEELAEAQKRLSPREQGSKRKSFHLIALGEFIRDVRPPNYLIDGVIETETMGVVFGDPGTYKTFVTLGMLLCVASGRPWHGRAVKQGPVVYIVGEGRQGIARRVLAWGKHNGVDVATLPFLVSSMSAALTDPKSVEEVAAAIAEVTKKYGAPVVVCVDTLARNFQGDENKTEDMTSFVSNVDRLGNSCVRLIVHHSGLGDKTRSRGNSALKGALDFEFCMAKRVDGIVEMNNTKMKDAPEWTEPMRFIPHTVSIGGDFDNPIESIVLEPYNPGPQEAVAGSAKMREAVDLLRELCDLQREDLKAGGHDPNGARVSKGEWREACVERRIYTRPATYDMMPAAARRGLIEMDGDYVYPKVSEVSECCQN